MEETATITNGNNVDGDEEEDGMDVDERLPKFLERLEELRERNRERAKRFQTEYVEPDPREMGISPAEFKRLMRMHKRKQDADPFVIGFDITSEEEMKKRAERAKKFGLEVDQTKVELRLYGKTEEELDEMKKRAQRFAVPVKSEVEVFTKVITHLKEDSGDHLQAQRRNDSLQLYSGATRGLHPIGTATILQKFKDYGVAWVEWLGERSCNVVFNEAEAAARVYMTLCAPVPLPNEISDEERERLTCWRVPLEPFVKIKSDDYGNKGATVDYIVRYATDSISDRKKPKPRKEQHHKKKKSGKSQRRRRGGRGNRRFNPYHDRRKNDSDSSSKASQASFEDRMGGALSSSR
jgi:hypothetical protein